CIPPTPAKTPLKPAAPAKIQRIMLDVLIVDHSEAVSIDHFNRREASAKSKVPTTPIAAPSVGVAAPVRIEPSTRPMRMIGNTRPRITLTTSTLGLSSSAADFGNDSGLSRRIMAM